jgi:hypothetical protein
MKTIVFILTLSILLSFAVCTPVNAENLMWRVAPILKYDEITFLRSYPLADRDDVFIAYTHDSMFFIDEITGDIVEETGPTGGFRYPYSYGFYPDTGAFFYSQEYSYWPEENDVVIQKSQNAVISVHELVITVENGYDYYEIKEGEKYAIYYNGKFVSDFIYDVVIGGNHIALVNQNDKYALADNTGSLITGFIYDDVAEIAKGYIAVKRGNAWGFVDSAGKEVIPYIFADAVNIDADTAFVKHNGKYGILDIGKTAENFSP